MFRIWAKVFSENRLVRDKVICNDNPDMTRTKKVFAALHDVCQEFDLPEPIWLDINISDFKKFAKTRFNQNNFMEEIPFDYLEFHVIEE